MKSLLKLLVILLLLTLHAPMASADNLFGGGASASGTDSRLPDPSGCSDGAGIITSGTIFACASGTGYLYSTSGVYSVKTLTQVKSDLGIVAWSLSANLRVCTDGSNNPVDCGTTPFVEYVYSPQKTHAAGHTYTEAEVAGGVLSNYNMSAEKLDHFPPVPTAGTKVVNFILLVETKYDANWDVIRQGSDTITLHKGDGTMVTGKTYLRFHDLPVNCLVSCFSQPNTAVWNCSLASATTCPVTTD
ncbi:MAG: hypothetical protein ABFD91_04080 [Anaerohalosphaeraceae bacterium]